MAAALLITPQNHIPATKGERSPLTTEESKYPSVLAFSKHANRWPLHQGKECAVPFQTLDVALLVVPDFIDAAVYRLICSGLARKVAFMTMQKILSTCSAGSRVY